MTNTNKELLTALRESFPQLFTTRTEDGETVERLDLEKIRLLAGEGNYSDRYGLRWENKPERFDAESVGKLPSLKHVASKSIRTDATKPTHVLIQGDNYHALKVLAYTHERSVDVIYIDPPYNTGNKDFVYWDDFSEKPKYVEKDDGFRHSKWLSFIAKRLRLAKSLLKESGVVFISIDDNSQAQLKLLCDQIMGEDNFISCSIWRCNTSVLKQSKSIRKDHEYVLVYARAKAKAYFSRRMNSMEFSNPDNDEKGPWFSSNAALPGNGDANRFPIKLPTGSEVTRNWKFTREDYEAGAVPLYFKGGNVPRLKVYESQYNRHTAVPSSILEVDATTSTGKNELASILGVAPKELSRIFSYPKPTELIRHVLEVTCPVDGCVVDFFAGSGTTGHAVMQLNAEDGGSRQCILVTNNEGEFKDESGALMEGGICTHVTHPRLKKVIEGYITPKGKEVAGLGENLEFFETSFVPVPQSKNQQQAFVRYSSSLLQLKAGCFTTVEQTPQWSLHTDGSKHLFVLFDDCAVEDALERLKSVEGPIVVYVFAYDNDDDSAEILSQSPNVTVQEVPQPLLDLFFRIKE